MFIAHFGVGFAAKKFAPALSLGALMIASQFLDLLWPSLLLLDVEQVRIYPGITAVTPLDFYNYPISHSLFDGDHLVINPWITRPGAPEEQEI